MKKSIILFLGIVVFSVAQEKGVSPYSSTFEACLKDNPHPDGCMEDELTYQDKVLNKTYKKAKESIQPFRQESLKDIQRVWIKYRDMKCDFFYHKERGSGGITDALMCKLDMTIERTEELKEIF